jgi:hypothetical protein
MKCELCPTKIVKESSGEKQAIRHTFCPDRDGLGDKLDLNTRDASGLGEGKD